MKSTALEGMHRSIWKVLWTVLAVLVIVSLSASVAGAQTDLAQAGVVPCLNTSATLEDLVQCVLRYMPNSYSADGRDGFDVPTATERSQWREVVGQMMSGQCENMNLGKYAWGGDFTVARFWDSGNKKSYCVLMETRYATYSSKTRVTHGWGTFIHDPSPLRELNISAPHALFDAGTANEAVRIFKNSHSRTFVMTGAHRNASHVTSGCQDEYKRSDAAHNTAHMFHATVAELDEYYRSRNARFYHLQYHRMASSSCPGVGVYMTHGMTKPPAAGDKVVELRANLLKYKPAWKVGLPGGSPPCDLNGSTNVQGRLLNGVPSGQECGRSAANYSGRFIHIEQQPNNYYATDWFAAVNSTWPTCVHCRPAAYLPLVGRNMTR